ncbi:MAG: hypothetical protein NVSMB6_05720 [Burkholderiaceae bacterium]
MKTLAALALLAVSQGCAGAHSQPAVGIPVAAVYTLPAQPKAILVVTDRVTGSAYDGAHATQVTIALRHFSPITDWLYSDQLTPQKAKQYDAIVYLGENANAVISTPALRALRSVKYLVVARSHIRQLHDAKVAFPNIQDLGDRRLSGHAGITYNRHLWHVVQDNYAKVTIRPPARQVAEMRWSGGSVPYVVRDGKATFVNGPIEYDQLEESGKIDQMIVVSDILNDALEAAPISKQHMALLRLEDVSVQTQALRLKAIVHYLAKTGISYGIGLIPDQLIKGQTLSTLRQDPELVSILRYAQNHGARIILHGLHHSFNSAEDFEFWDIKDHRPLRQDSRSWMHAKIQNGLQIEESLGRHPKIWETPHYMASPLDYKEVSSVFNCSWEQRDPVGWLPWVLQSDQYGSRLLPEDLGYISVDGTYTLELQLVMARKLLACRGCVAAGFLHPSTVAFNDVRGYVEGLEKMGYVFGDPAGFLPDGKSRRL